MADNKVKTLAFTCRTSSATYVTVLEVHPDGKLYGRGTCCDTAWNDLLNKESKVHLLNDVEEVTVSSHGFSVRYVSTPEIPEAAHTCAAEMVLDSTGPNGLVDGPWLAKPVKRLEGGWECIVS